MIKRGDIVRLLPQWQDLGDDALTWAALEDEDGGRVLIEARGTGLTIAPAYVVRINMLEGQLCES